MIIIKNKKQAEFSIPRNADYSGLFVIKIYSPVGLWANEYDVVDDASSKNFYTFLADFSNLPDGEFNYTLKQDGADVATGIMQVGDGKADDYYVQYPFSLEYEQYYPSIKSFITLETDEHLSESATAITYHVRTNSSWSLQVFIRHHTQSEWSPWPPESHTEKNYYGTINIGPQVEDYPKHFKIVVTTKDGEASAEQEIVQDAHYYFSVDVFSPYESISWSATELSYGIQYSEYQAVHTGTFFIYRNGELFKEQPFGWYPHGFSTYTQIPENDTNSAVTYTITGILDNGQNDTCVVVQNANVNPLAQPFAVEMLEDGDINWEGRGYEYYDIIRDGKRDEGNQLDHGVFGLKAGDIVEFYLMTDNTNKIGTSITSAAKHNVFGNIMSLIFADYTNVSAITTEYQFENLFKGDTGLLSAENLLLPAKNINWGAYEGMFWNCTNLTTPPAVLPATITKISSYTQMFQGCTSLTTMPIISATSDYSQFMFAGCTSLTETTTLNRGDDNMFVGCTNLSYIKCLAYHPASMSEDDLKQKNFNWVENVSPTGTFVKKRGSKWLTGNHGIPENWTVVEVDE